MRDAILMRLAIAWLWVYWRLPRLWMNRTAYAFWILGEREKYRAAKCRSILPLPAPLTAWRAGDE